MQGDVEHHHWGGRGTQTRAPGTLCDEAGLSLFYLNNPHLSSDLRQSRVEVVRSQGLPPHGLMLIGSNPINENDRTRGTSDNVKDGGQVSLLICQCPTLSVDWSSSPHRSRTDYQALRCSDTPQ